MPLQFSIPVGVLLIDHDISSVGFEFETMSYGVWIFVVVPSGSEIFTRPYPIHLYCAGQLAVGMHGTCISWHVNPKTSGTAIKVEILQMITASGFYYIWPGLVNALMPFVDPTQLVVVNSSA